MKYPDEVGEPSAACTDPSASSRTHEPHIGDNGEQDAVLLKKRSSVHPRTVHEQERPYKYWVVSIPTRLLYPDEVGEPSAACSDPSASLRTHEPHIGDNGEQDAVLLKKRSSVHPRTVHEQERPYKYWVVSIPTRLLYPDEVGEPSAACSDPSASSRTHEPHICDNGEQDAVLLKKRSSVHPRTVHGQERPYKYVSEIIVGGFDPHPPSIKERPQCATGSVAARTLTRKVVGVDAAYFPDCDDEYPDDVGEPSAACTDPSAFSRTHEPHIGDHGEQDAVLPKKRSPVHPRTVHGQENCDDEYPDEVGEPSAACTDPSASSRTHEPHIGDNGEQDAVLLKKRSSVHPRTVHGQERPYKYWVVSIPTRLLYPDEVGEPSAACSDPSASSRTHEPHIGDNGEQDAVLLKKRSSVHPRTVHGQERPYKYVSEIIVGGFDPHPPSIKERPQCATGSVAARTLTRKVVGVDAAYCEYILCNFIR
ncbi:unnamed protein product [Pieris macdunnoughi]|uniref:Uncharacterized protein n=1 Tax=Pieris macdunnoughi TaxID=345717 RepID=A0A821TA75_9NEOP|nr:unnamed protein product [Pieris macdunnoughi]